jgi:hypothetical protein
MPPSMQSGRCFTVVDLVFEGPPNILLIDKEANRHAPWSVPAQFCSQISATSLRLASVSPSM